MMTNYTLLALMGITIIISSSEIFSGIREKVSEYSEFLGKLISCTMCTGFWVGFFFSLLGISDISPLFLGALISISSWGFFNIVDYFIIKATWYATKVQAYSRKMSDLTEEDKKEDDKDVENE
jgi:hypothetical protein